MKKFVAIALFSLLFVSCYTVPKTTADAGFLLSPQIAVNGYYGKAIGVCGDFAFVGDANRDVKKDDGTVVKEGGLVRVLQYSYDQQKWNYVLDADGDVISFSSSDCKDTDAFGSAILFAESATDASKKFLFVSSLLADTKYGTYDIGPNNGAVYMFKVVPEKLAQLAGKPKTELKNYLPDFLKRISLDSADVSGVDNMQSFLPSPTNSEGQMKMDSVKDEIQVSQINPGIGFGWTIRYDADSEVLVVGAPYESYFKDYQGTGNRNLLSRPGAAYVFEPEIKGDYTKWKFQSRLMPLWYQPIYENSVYYDKDQTYLGEVVKPKMSDDKQVYELHTQDRNDYYFGEKMAVNDNTIAVAVRTATFQYYRRSQGSKPADGEWYDYDKKKVTAPEGEIFKYTENNPGVGCIYLFQKNDSGKWEFKRRILRNQWKKDEGLIASNATEQYKNTVPGMYITDGDNFYQYSYYFGENLGSEVEIYGKHIIIAVPYTGRNITGYNDIGVNKVWKNMGSIVFVPIEFSGEYNQLTDHDKWMHNNNLTIEEPFWGENFKRRGDVLAVCSPGHDYQVLQYSCGLVEFYQISPDGDALTLIPNTKKLTTEELYKGSQTIGRYMDFSVENGQAICGVPDLGMTIYYDKPYVQNYWLSCCGAIYTYKWK